ncbi:hypothetical protein Tco_0725479 [Tanacetum coccineum]|uniref:Xylulose kinase-1 n=1 Tax=Tanacetum coccineum TaxID=301880 RepID=A0ABQ4YD61_9ASTR
MVACLERIYGNAEFHQIVDFLTTSPIHYALTVSPTIYASYIKQFWATAKSKTVNGVKQIHATVDLHFNDEDGITCLSNDEIFIHLALMGQIALAEPFNDVYVTPVYTKKVFTNMKRQNKDFSGTVTLLFASMLVPQVVESEGDDDRVVRVATTATSLETEQESEVNTSGSKEDSMEHQDDLTDFVPPTPHDSSLSGDNTPGSDEGRPNINELIVISTRLSNRVLALETSKSAQDLVIKKLEKKVKRLEKKQRARTLGMKLFKIGTSRRKSLDKENVSKQERNLKTRPMFEEGDFDDDFDDMVNKEIENVKRDTVNAGGAVNTATTGVSTTSASVTTAGVSISTAEPRTPPTTTTTAFEYEDLTIAQTLVKMRNVEESARSTTILLTIDPKDKGKGIMQEPEKPLKNPKKAQIQRDAEISQRLFEEEQAQFEREQRIARERAAQEEASNAALIAEFDDVQARMDADALLAARLQEEEREQFSIDEQARFLVETRQFAKKSATVVLIHF